MKNIIFLVIVLFPGSIFAQSEKDSVPFNTVYPKPLSWLTDKEPGAQLGFSYQNSFTLEIGANYYWSINPDWRHIRSHTFGPFACADINFIEGVTYMGERLGFNYHFWNIGSVQVSPTFQHIAKNDLRIGCDIGGSFCGIYAYYGYYAPIGKEELPGTSPHRFGLRFVFNMAPVNTTPMN